MLLQHLPEPLVVDLPVLQQVVQTDKKLLEAGPQLSKGFGSRTDGLLVAACKPALGGRAGGIRPEFHACCAAEFLCVNEYMPRLKGDRLTVICKISSSHRQCSWEEDDCTLKHIARCMIKTSLVKQFVWCEQLASKSQM